jgi:hypothetical protein
MASVPLVVIGDPAIDKNTGQNATTPSGGQFHFVLGQEL